MRRIPAFLMALGLPGQFIAWELPYGLALSLFVLFRGVGGNLSIPAAGVALMIVGTYLGGQAVHLDQEDHEAPPATLIELAQQQHKLAFMLVGLATGLVGVELL